MQTHILFTHKHIHANRHTPQVGTESETGDPFPVSICPVWLFWLWLQVLLRSPIPDRAPFPFPVSYSEQVFQSLPREAVGAGVGGGVGEDAERGALLLTGTFVQEHLPGCRLSGATSTLLPSLTSQHFHASGSLVLLQQWVVLGAQRSFRSGLEFSLDPSLQDIWAGRHHVLGQSRCPWAPLLSQAWSLFLSQRFPFWEGFQIVFVLLPLAGSCNLRLVGG